MYTGIQISSLAPVMINTAGFEECVSRLTGMGYIYTQLQWIDPSVSAEDIGRILRKYGMISLGTQEKYDALAGRLDEFIQINLEAQSDDVCFSTIPERFFSERSLDDFIGEMKAHMEYLKRYGLHASFHPTKNDFRLINGKHACDIVFESIPELRIVPDTNQLLRAKADITAWLKKYKTRIDMIHFKDMTGLDENAKLVPVGRGITDFRSLIPTLNECGVRYILAEQEKWEGDPFERMKESYLYIESLK